MVKASVIIVNYKADKFIGKCLESVAKNRYKYFETIVIDNNKINVGSCEARNQGARKARGKYLIFFDCDTEIDKNCIGEYVKAFEKYPDVGAMHGKSLNMEYRDKFDSTGELFDKFGFLSDRAGFVHDRGQFDYIANIASGKACSYAIRSDLFKKLGGYDKDFFFFVEEPDFDMRVWMSGYRVIFLPSAVIWHAFGTKLKAKDYYSRYLVRYYGARNYILMLLKNFSGGRLLKVLPFMTMSLLSLSLLFIVRGKFSDGYYMIKGIFWNVFNFGKMLKKRAVVQKMRKVNDGDLNFLFVKKPFGHYKRKIKSYYESLL